jgi:hypothetical protein
MSAETLFATVVLRSSGERLPLLALIIAGATLWLVVLPAEIALSFG